MAGYKTILNDQQIAALTDFIYQPPPRHELKWGGKAEIRSSREVSHPPQGSLPDEPVFEADLMNLFLVVEIGDHHVTLLDGDKMEPFTGFPAALPCTAGRSTARTVVMCTSLPGWLDYQIRYLQPESGGRSSRRHQHAQHRGFR